ncbi:uncharacterized protein LOC108735852 isoform X2 [Agrilus planipennis]|uniref:Uncharacterized protein LOC108735852 isoform X2 n=1 Tax=Agrilus planipennis TaxID=224129 RepID=A0A1W4WHX8_AGRPL|nr:uncharacterized protein LOC108735852 isoform X2 [Agrilus planipennis]
MHSDKTDLFYVFCTFCLLTTVLGAARIAAEDGVPTAQSTKFLPYTPESEGFNYQKSPYEDCCRKLQESQWAAEGQGQVPLSYSSGLQGQWPVPPYQVQNNEYPVSGGGAGGYGGPAPMSGAGGYAGYGGPAPMPEGEGYNGYGGPAPVPEMQYPGPGLNYKAFGSFGQPSGIGANLIINPGYSMPQREMYAPAQEQGQVQYYQPQQMSSPEYYPSFLDNSLNFRKFHNKKFSKVQGEESNGAAGNFKLQHFGGIPYARKAVFYGERIPNSEFLWKNGNVLSEPTGDTSAKVLEGK